MKGKAKALPFFGVFFAKPTVIHTCYTLKLDADGTPKFSHYTQVLRSLRQA
ncbi:hypothetical protein LX64_01184 [Chitinophaga skermanii]|uniref:Uncharacterized protein n=1 Tax=Chitinophaga skermanii TaxID=331697 RepID=A0A327QVZ5_9BACT|nr:hypothetical protein LX64_01184 [Chitinophaga skermanii]